MTDLARLLRRYLDLLVRRFVADQPRNDYEFIVFGALRLMSYTFVRRLA